jgi:hypothetical protein
VRVSGSHVGCPWTAADQAVRNFKTVAEASEDSGHPDNEWVAVVAHELEWLAAELKALLEPSQDGRRLSVGVDSKADKKTGMVVDQAELLAIANSAMT